MEKLVKFHLNVDLQTRDFEAFATGMAIVLKEKINPPPDALAAWGTFLKVLFNRWASAIGQPPLGEEDVEVDHVQDNRENITPTEARGSEEELFSSRSVYPLRINEDMISSVSTHRPLTPLQPLPRNTCSPGKEESVVVGVPPLHHVAPSSCPFAVQDQVKGKPLPLLSMPPKRVRIQK